MSRLTYLNESRETTELTQFEGDSWQELIEDADAVDQVFMHNAIDKLYEYEQLEEQGLLLKLPCKVGDTVWEVDEGILSDDVIEPIKCKVTYILIKSAIHIDVEVIEGHGVGSTYTFELDDFGKTVFLTKEEAEQKLKKMIRLDKLAGKYADNEVLKPAT